VRDLIGNCPPPTFFASRVFCILAFQRAFFSFERAMPHLFGLIGPHVGCLPCVKHPCFQTSFYETLAPPAGLVRFVCFKTKTNVRCSFPCLPPLVALVSFSIFGFFQLLNFVLPFKAFFPLAYKFSLLLPWSLLNPPPLGVGCTVLPTWVQGTILGLSAKFRYESKICLISLVLFSNHAPQGF